MRAIIVDDEPIMIRSFKRLTQQISNLEIMESFYYPDEALEYVEHHPIDVAFLDVEMPIMNGIELAKKLRSVQSNLMVVFITAYDTYVHESNALQADYYIVKPYTKETIEFVVKRLAKLAGESEKKKPLYIKCFGRFTLLKDGKPVSLVGKAKEILAYLVTKRGHEVSNEEIYRVLWEDRYCDNVHMKVYFNAVRRLQDNLEKEGLSELFISTARGKMINTDLFDCDYYAWKDGKSGKEEQFNGEFLSEYSWGEEILAEMTEELYGK